MSIKNGISRSSRDMKSIIDVSICKKIDKGESNFCSLGVECFWLVSFKTFGIIKADTS